MQTASQGRDHYYFMRGNYLNAVPSMVDPTYMVNQFSMHYVMNEWWMNLPEEPEIHPQELFFQ